MPRVACGFSLKEFPPHGLLWKILVGLTKASLLATARVGPDTLHRGDFLDHSAAFQPEERMTPSREERSDLRDVHGDSDDTTTARFSTQFSIPARLRNWACFLSSCAH